VVHNASLKRERLGRQDYSGWELLLWACPTIWPLDSTKGDAFK
jgi:hypothetical protein